jgi:folate-binding protein YgfZ
MFSRDQYDAAHDAAIVADGFSAGTIVFTGADRRSFLHGLLTNDIASLTQGTGTYAAYLTPQGRMISDMRVIETGERLSMAVERGVAAALASRFDGLIFSEDVQVSDASPGTTVIAVHGPSAAAMVERAAEMPLSGLTKPYDNTSAGSVTVVRDDYFGVPGYELYVPANAGGALRQRIVREGAVPASAATLETLRIEARRPRFGVDMTPETIPLEAGIEQRAISFTKGCYVGQEVIIRVMHRGHGRVARRLVAMILAGAAVPGAGDAIVFGQTAVGEVTSAAASPRANAPVALGYVHRDHASPGSELTINGSQARVDQPVD